MKGISHGESCNGDFVVIGAGAAGLAADLTMAEGGGKVIVFEKMAAAGGASNFAEGMFANLFPEMPA